MTAREDFTPEEWQVVLEGPPSAGCRLALEHLDRIAEVPQSVLFGHDLVEEFAFPVLLARLHVRPRHGDRLPEDSPTLSGHDDHAGRSPRSTTPAITLPRNSGRDFVRQGEDEVPVVLEPSRSSGGWGKRQPGQAHRHRGDRREPGCDGPLSSGRRGQLRDRGWGLRGPLPPLCLRRMCCIPLGWADSSSPRLGERAIATTAKRYCQPGTNSMMSQWQNVQVGSPNEGSRYVFKCVA
jgi:hypothetical protein